MQAFAIDERQLQAAVRSVKRRGRERSVVVGGESNARLGYGPGTAVDDSRLIGVARGGERRELLRGDAVSGIEHAIEDGPVVLRGDRGRKGGRVEHVEELEVEVAARYQHGRHLGVDAGDCSGR